MAEAPSSGKYLDLTELAALSSKRDLLKAQMEQARALGEPSGRKYATWGGALAGGLGDILGGIAGRTKEGRLAEELAATSREEQGKLGEFNAAMNRLDATPDEQERLALQAIATGHHGLGETGKAWLDYGGKKLTRAMQEKERRDAAERARIDDERAQKGLELREQQDEWNRTHPAQTYVVGAGNQIYAAPTHVETGTVPIATPAQTAPAAAPPPGSQPLVKPVDVSDSETKVFEELTAKLGDIRDLQNTFKDEYSGGGLVGEGITALGQSSLVGNLAPKAVQERGGWWSKYATLVAMKDRHDLFGGSLTPGEKESFAKAQRATAGKDAALAREAMAEIEAHVAARLAGRKKAAVLQGRSPQAVEALTQVLGTRPAATEAPPINTETPVREPPAPITPPAKSAIPKAKARASGNQTPAATVRMRDKSGKVWDVDPSEVAEALKNKWEKL